MRQIRRSLFETNSSSTHALVIPKTVQNKNYEVYGKWDEEKTCVEFGRGEFELYDQWDDKLSYAYIALQDREFNQKAIETFKDNVRKCFDEVFKMEENKHSFNKRTPDDIFKYVDKGEWNYVDHSSEIPDEFFDKLINDIDFVKRFIFNSASYITVGGDEYRGYYIKTIGFEYDYDDWNWECKGKFWDKLKEYQKDNDVYLKGN